LQRMSNFSQMRQGAGNKMLARASCASLSKDAAVRRRVLAESNSFAN
jgi:hypothetical protein